ncbi:MAG: hypothetical protein IPJ88_16430 [Myxococcales bacterium]|nr:MAG: hypothetical protein IPJ88_16430 [Myxococcales bacterium]
MTKITMKSACALLLVFGLQMIPPPYAQAQEQSTTPSQQHLRLHLRGFEDAALQELIKKRIAQELSLEEGAIDVLEDSVPEGGEIFVDYNDTGIRLRYIDSEGRFYQRDTERNSEHPIEEQIALVIGNLVRDQTATFEVKEVVLPVKTPPAEVKKKTKASKKEKYQKPKGVNKRANYLEPFAIASFGVFGAEEGLGAQLGADVGLRINGFGLSGGFNISHTAYTANVFEQQVITAPSMTDYNAPGSVTWLSLPFTFSYRADLSRTISLDVGAGPGFSIGIANVEEASETNTTGYLHSMLGLSFKLSARTRFSFNPFFRYNLSKTTTSALIQVTQTQPSQRSIVADVPRYMGGALIGLEWMI